MMELSDFLAPLAAMLLGGLVASLGPSLLARRPSLRDHLLRTKGWGIALYFVGSLAVAAGAVFWFMQLIRGQPDAAAPAGSVLMYLFFGLALGLPFSTPGVWSVWSSTRSDSRAARRRRSRAATPKERLDYAEDLARQIRDVSPERSSLRASLSGEKERVLVFEGPLEREEGDRLVASFRSDMKELGFQRLEGEGTAGKWWSKV